MITFGVGGMREQGQQDATYDRVHHRSDTSPRLARFMSNRHCQRARLEINGNDFSAPCNSARLEGRVLCYDMTLVSALTPECVFFSATKGA